MTQRKTIVMIHGFRGTHHGLAKVAAHLPSSYNIIIPDIPGFGEGEALDDYSLDSYVAWLHRFITSLHATQPPILLGHSFGSIIAATYAKRYPETIQKLVLVNPIGVPALEGPRAILTKLAQFHYWLGRKLPPKIAMRWLSAKPVMFIMSTTMTKTPNKQLRKWIHHQHYRHFSSFHSAESVSQAFTTSVSHNVRDVAAAITVPTALIVGERDDITPLDKQYELHELFPSSSLHVINNVGHLTHYETPEEVASVTHAFVSRLP